MEELEFPSKPERRGLPAFLMQNPSNLARGDKADYKAQLNLSAINERLSEENIVSISGQKVTRGDVSHSDILSAMPSQNMSFLKTRADNSSPIRNVQLNLRSQVSIQSQNEDLPETPQSIKGLEASTNLEETHEMQSSHSQASKKVDNQIYTSPLVQSARLKLIPIKHPKSTSLAASLKSTPKLTLQGTIPKDKERNRPETSTKVRRSNLEVESSLSNFKLGGPITWQLIFEKKKETPTQSPLLSASCTLQSACQGVPSISRLFPLKNLSAVQQQADRAEVLKKVLGHRRTHSDTQTPVHSARVKAVKQGERTSFKGEPVKKPDFGTNFSKKGQPATARPDIGKKTGSATQALLKGLKKDNNLKKKENLMLREENLSLRRQNLAYKIVGLADSDVRSASSSGGQVFSLDRNYS